MIVYDSSANDLAQIRRPADVLWCSNSGSVRHMKSEIIQELGQTDLVLPARVGEGLAAWWVYRAWFQPRD